MTSSISRLSAASILCLSLLITACSGPPPTQPPEAQASAVSHWLTTGDQSKLLSREADATFTRDSNETFPSIVVDASTTYQQMDGVGAALTDASAWLIFNKLSAEQRSTLIRDLFTPDGAGFDYVRLPMGSSDFALSHYSYDDLSAGQTDPTLTKFSIAHDREYILPVAQQIRGTNGAVKFMASPWSAPGWMKTTDSLIKGSLKPEFYGAYAQYFRKFIQEYGAAGVPIHAVTLQNEPHHEPDNYPGMRMEPAEQAAFVKVLGPTLKSAGLSPRIIAWDHNWDEWFYPVQVLNDAEAAQYIDGSAFHCYAGNVNNQQQVHDTFPAKNLYFTECSGGYWANNFPDNLRWNTSNLLIGATRNWAKTVLLWNLALQVESGSGDQTKSGPHKGGCDNCRGIVTIGAGGSVEKNVEYYVLGQYGKAVRPGAVRISSNTYNVAGDMLQSVAFRNPDGSKVLIALNNTADPLPFKVKEGNASFYTQLPPASVVTYRWTGSGSDAAPGQTPALDAFARMQAEYYSSMKGVQTEETKDEGGGNDVGWTDAGDYLVFDQVNFTAPATGVQVRVASGANGGTVEIRTGSETGPLVATVQVPGTGDWQNWKTVSAPANLPAGNHKLYVVFKNGGLNLNWLQFTH